MDDLFNRLMDIMSGKNLTYRQRLDKRFPQMHEDIANNAMKTMDALSRMDNDEATEYIKNNQLAVVDGIYGLLNAIEIVSQGKIASRNRGPSPVNMIAAFNTWLWQNPDIVQQFMDTDLYKELIDSGRGDSYTWADDEDDAEADVIPFDRMPGDYL